MRFILAIGIVWLICLTACAKRPAVYVEQLSPIPLKAGKPFTPPQDGWFLTNPALAELLANQAITESRQ